MKASVCDRVSQVNVYAGLGGAVAKRFAKGGFSVALVSRRAESAQQALDQIKSDGGEAEIILADTGLAI